MTADLRDQTLQVAGRIEPELMTGAQAREALEDLAIADKAMAGTLLFLALRVARANGWQGQGFKSPEDWLASQLGCSVSEARRQLGTARKADKLDKTKEAMMEDAFLAAVIMKGHDVVNVAHLGRAPNAHQRTAMEAAGVACRNICCNRTVNIEADHRVPYATTRETKLDNLDWLCGGNGGCHDLKTHHGHQLEAGTGRRRLLPPDHPNHKQHTGPETDTGPPEPDRIEQPTLC